MLLLDIEGTICPISFVKDTLYPYFTAKLPSYLSKETFPITSPNGTEITPILFQLPPDARESKEKAEAHFARLVSHDIKDAVLKSLQGFVWKEGYESGDIKAPVYPDAVQYIQNSKEKIYIYSSGSVKAQILLFQYVQDPEDPSKTINLNPYLSGYFDINTSGYKQEKESYKRILESIGSDGKDVLFLSDNVKEVDAAIEAGLRSWVVERPGNAKFEGEYRVIRSLEELVNSGVPS